MSGADRAVRPAHAGEGRIGVIAGGGSLPLAVVTTLRDGDADPYVILIEGEVENPTAYSGIDQVTMKLEDFGLLVPRLKAAGVKRLLMAGSVNRRPRLRAIRWTVSTLKLIPRVAAALSRGDDGLLRAMVRLMEAEGIAVVGAHEVVPDLVTPQGLLGRHRPTEADWRDIHAGSEAAAAIGLLDIGQAAIAIGGRAIALEGIEGTEGLLERTAAMRGHGRLAGRQRGALVKRCKPRQEQRADLPAIGSDTVDQAHAAGLAGIAMEAGRSFILDFNATIARADALGLYIVGIVPGEKQP